VNSAPERERRVLWRSFAAAILIVLLTAGASATAALLTIDDWIPDPDPGPGGREGRQIDNEKPKPGKPQTILLMGSDKRWQDQSDDPARSDTLMLIRIDPKQDATTVLSIPRDLRVAIPGHGLAKINDAYALGGAPLAVDTVKALTGLDINHTVNVNFKGFRKVVNLFDCFYVDVDRDYFHSNKGVAFGQRYDAIDINPGYQPLCGQKALDYARYRHGDSDLTRAARQQDFLRFAKDQVSTSELIDDLKKLAQTFFDAAETDDNLRSTQGFLRLSKLSLDVTDLPIRQVQFPATFVKDVQGEQEVDFVEASPVEVAETVDLFLHGGKEKAKPVPLVKRKAKRLAADANLVDARSRGREATAKIRKRAGFTVRFPAFLTQQGRYGEEDDAPRTYGLRDRGGTLHRAYRIVLAENPADGQFYGVQGTTWRNPPLLASPSEVRRVRGRRLELFRSGRRLRFVAWRTDSAAYWISNTLNLKLDNDEMLALAASLTSK
jgi:polyisoprenyl-teichoic acid--peptidoglycan teichoic acid transferase